MIFCGMAKLISLQGKERLQNGRQPDGETFELSVICTRRNAKQSKRRCFLCEKKRVKTEAFLSMKQWNKPGEQPRRDCN